MASAPWECGREDRANAKAARGLPSHERTVPTTLTIPTTAIPTIVTLTTAPATRRTCPQHVCPAALVRFATPPPDVVLPNLYRHGG